ncbi:hypothetical protein bt91E135_001505 (plasmid) [Borrelia turicatae 91E135]|nr:hypothetical protein bt91E135_001505 [Borrelia turicatae 91E135]
MLLTSILLSRSLMSDFNSLLTVSILLSSSLNLVSILELKLFSTVLILVSSSLNLVSILVSSSALTDLISACKRASTFSSLRLKLFSTVSIFLSSSLNLVSILVLRLFSTESILVLNSSLILLIPSSKCFNFISKFSFKYSISL